MLAGKVMDWEWVVGEWIRPGSEGWGMQLPVLRLIQVVIRVKAVSCRIVRALVTANISALIDDGGSYIPGMQTYCCHKPQVQAAIL